MATPYISGRLSRDPKTFNKEDIEQKDAPKCGLSSGVIEIATSHPVFSKKSPGNAKKIAKTLQGQKYAQLPTAFQISPQPLGQNSRQLALLTQPNHALSNGLFRIFATFQPQKFHS